MHNPKKVRIHAYFVSFSSKSTVHKWARRAINNCLNDMNRSALERRGFGASFEGYYTFVGDLDVALSEVKEHA